MIEPVHLFRYVIEPTLAALPLPSPTQAAELLLLTAAQESQCGRYLRQIGGPAIGIYQMEPRTFRDLWTTFLPRFPQLAKAISNLTDDLSPEAMTGNLYFATAMARVYYFRVPHALPPFRDGKAMAAYWKRHYNTELGAGTAEAAQISYSLFIEPNARKLWPEPLQRRKGDAP